MLKNKTKIVFLEIKYNGITLGLPLTSQTMPMVASNKVLG
jgi:hypothetical protein